MSLPGGGRLGRAIAASAAALVIAVVAFAVVGSSGGAPRRPRVAPRTVRSAVADASIDALISRTIGGDERRYWISPTAPGLRGSNGDMSIDFSSAGVRVATRRGAFGLTLESLGRGAGRVAVAPASPIATRNRVTYRRHGLEEWYANGPAGLEQGFTVGARPAGVAGTPLTLALGLSGNLRASPR